MLVCVAGVGGDLLREWVGIGGALSLRRAALLPAARELLLIEDLVLGMCFRRNSSSSSPEITPLECFIPPPKHVTR